MKYFKSLKQLEIVMILLAVLSLLVLEVCYVLFLGQAIPLAVFDSVAGITMVVVFAEVAFYFVKQVQNQLKQEIKDREAIEKKLLLHSTALESAANAIAITDINGRFLWANPAFTTLTGYAFEEVVGQTPVILRSGKQDDAFYAHLWQTVLDGDVWEGELINRRKDGRLYTEEQVITPVLNENGRSTTNNPRSLLLPLLHEAQNLYGWFPREVQQAISRTLRVPEADIHGVIEFYTMFYNQPTAKRVVRICDGMSCHVQGSDAVMDAIEEELGLQPGETSADGKITYECVPCLGMCEHGPNALDDTKTAGRLTPDTITDFLNGSYPEPRSKVYGQPLVALKRIGEVNPLSLTDYEAHGGYQGLHKALALPPEALISASKESEILGRGGAMFPLGLKSEFVRNAPGSPEEKHIVVNADESEPGTFKDRTLMEEDPFSIIEAATLMGYTVGAANGWILVRGEYPRSYARLQTAVSKARAAGYLGKNVMGHTGFDFDIEVRLGAGAYICGEETALFEAVEGKRGFPRIKPPYPPSQGLFNQPTSINNVETLVMALAAFNMGHKAWRELGTEKSPGTKLFCLSGHIAKPGTYEIEFGMTIRELLEMAGGVPDGKQIQALLFGGAAGTFIGPERLDMPLTYEDARANGVSLGSGAIIVFDETAVLRKTLYQLSHFFAHESCGKCFPCQMDTQRQMEILERVAHHSGPKPTDQKALLDIGFAMTETSLCGLGQTAASAVMSAIALWPELISQQKDFK